MTVLKEYRTKFIRGRQLDLESEVSLCEGKTIEIFVTRSNIYQDAMDELLTSPPLEDVSYPLEVTFIAEAAADYGGPRKEFLGCVMRSIRDKLFVSEAGNYEFELNEDVTEVSEDHYYGAGLIFGKLTNLSIVFRSLINNGFSKLITARVITCTPT